MDTMEVIVFLVSGFLLFVFLKKWYQPLFFGWPPERNKPAKYIFGWLPAVSLAIIVYTLKVLASFDVVDSFIYIVFYIVMGYAWLYFGLELMSLFFDLSWIDDAVNLNNKAALISITGGFLAVTAIYSGANIGDGPGWWCVVFAGGLGLFSWLLLGLIINLFTGIFERITIERDIYCGIRLCLYLLASGLILGRASAGDWTSFYMTVAEFMIGWPVLPLAALMILIELYYKQKSKTDFYADNFIGSIFWGIIYILIAIASIMLLPPLSNNPLKSGISSIITQLGGIL